MADPVEAMSAATYARLSAPAAVSADVFTHALEGTPFPVVIIGAIEDVQPVARADDPDRRGTVTIIVMTEGEEREPCSAIMDQIHTALNGETVTVGPWHVTFYFETSSAGLDETGAGYVGETRFTAIALTD